MVLERTAKLPFRAIERIERRRLASLVGFARVNSPHYADKYAGVRDSDFELADLPITSKAELMDNFDRVLTVDDVRRDDLEAFFADDSNLGQLYLDKYAVSHTSGSQGQPLFLVQSPQNLELLFALQASRGNHDPLGLADVATHLASPARLAAVTLKPGFYPSAAAFKYLPAGAEPFLKLLQVSSIDDDMVEQLAEFRPTHLTSYASILHELARNIEQRRLDLRPDLKQVVNISERLMPKTRQRYQEVFGAPVLDDYGMGECMFLTNGCPTSGGMHVNADWAILEVVDADNQPVPPGNQGAKVLVTNLANRIQPFIRYEVGDLVTMAEQPCDCGSNLPLVARVGGRDSEMFFIETDEGRQPLSPVVFEHGLTHLLDAREYQIIQEENNRFRILLEPLSGADFDHARAERVIDEQLDSYDLRAKIDVSVEVVKRLEAEEGQKFKRVIPKDSQPADQVEAA
jgi:phenylacetate-coenzyme A ligase PaaK-like adenylate-forming protein